jgi:hypothetical protein
MKYRLKFLPESRTFTRTFLIPTLIVTALSLAFAYVITKKRDFQGQATLRLCQKTADGRWKEIDKWTIPDLNLQLSVADAVSGAKQFTTTSDWQGTTDKGRKVVAKLARPGSVQLDLKTGKIQVDIPFDITVDGKKLPTTVFTASTGTAAGPNGPISGEAGQVNLAERSLKFKLVGSKEIRVQAELVEDEEVREKPVKSNKEIIDRKTQPGPRGVGIDIDPQRKTQSGASLSETVLIVGEVSGKAKAVDR